MKRKYILFLMQVFTSICMLSIGYSSWAICTGDSLEISGNFVAEDVITNTDYILISNDSNMKLDYYETGFINENDEVVLTGTMSIEYTIVLKNCNSLYEDSIKNIRVKSNLCSTGSNLYSYVSESYTVLDENNTVVASGNDVITSENFYFEFIIANVLHQENQKNEYKFTIQYSFTASSHEDFRKSIYPIMDDIAFNATASINGE